MKSFKESVYQVVRKIPKGETLSYKQVAILIGRPKAYRAVGNVLNKNDDPTVPCHRVIRNNGEIGGFRHGTAKKRQLLKSEKVKI
ncbi:MAG: MGMT family protein [Candidatus Pacebacteria bacterium]|jgi:O-6-methylguanine DNA methyltransferase|nr:MGMT family protein [Candidatus Paceibacterota bacterium]